MNGIVRGCLVTIVAECIESSLARRADGETQDRVAVPPFVARQVSLNDEHANE